MMNDAYKVKTGHGPALKAEKKTDRLRAQQ